MTALAPRAAAWRSDGRRLPLTAGATEIIFPPGAGGLPTLKLGVVYPAPLDLGEARDAHELRYADENFPERSGLEGNHRHGRARRDAGRQHRAGTDRSRG